MPSGQRPATPGKGPHDATKRSDLRRLLFPPSRPLRDGTGASLSDLPRGDANAAAAAATAPRPARCLRRSRRVRERVTQTVGWFRLAVLGAAAVYAVLFIAFNTHRSKIDFVFASTKVSLIFVVLLSLAIGFVLGYLAAQLRRHRQHGG